MKTFLDVEGLFKLSDSERGREKVRFVDEVRLQTNKQTKQVYKGYNTKGAQEIEARVSPDMTQYDKIQNVKVLYSTI